MSKVKWIAGTFTVVPNRDRLFDLKPEVLKIYIALCSFADAQGECWPSYKTIADRAKCKARTCIRHIQALQKLGFISVKRRPITNGDNESNVYRIIELPSVTADSRGSVTPDSRVVSGPTQPPSVTADTLTNSDKTNTQNESDSERVLSFWQEKVGAIYESDLPAARLAATELIKRYGLELTAETITLYVEMRQASYRYCPNITGITKLAESEAWSKVIHNGDRFKADKLANETPTERAMRNKRKSLLDLMAEEKHREELMANVA